MNNKAKAGITAALAITGLFMTACSPDSKDLEKFEQCVSQKSEVMGVAGVVQNFEFNNYYLNNSVVAYAVKRFGTSEAPNMVDFGYGHEDIGANTARVKRNIDTPQANILETAVKICAGTHLGIKL